MNGLKDIFESALKKARKEIQKIDLDEIHNLEVMIQEIDGDKVRAIGISKTHGDLLGSHTVVTYPPLDALQRIKEGHEQEFFEEEILFKPEIDMYIHIPFCDYLCTYCSYTTLGIKKDNEVISRYLEALKREVRTWKKKLDKTKVRSLYIGGGTPFALDVDRLEELILFLRNEIPFIDSPEICIETSPKATISPDAEKKLKMLVEQGLTRISIGIQSFDYDILKHVGRTFRDYTSHEERAIKLLLDYVSHVNIDMMQDLPTKNNNYFKTLGYDLQKVAELRPHHVTWYNTRVRPERKKKGHVAREKESLIARLAIWNFMEEIGYKILEADRFALQEKYEDKFRKTRGSVQTGLLGLGVSAYSRANEWFFQNPRQIGSQLRANSRIATKDYIEAIQKNGFAIKWIFDITVDEKLAGEFALGFKRGIDLNRLFPAYYTCPGVGAYLTYTNHLVHQLVEKGLVKVTKEGVVQLTRNGRLWENEICSLYYTPRAIKRAAERRGELTPTQLEVWRFYEKLCAYEQLAHTQKNISNYV